MQNRLPLLILFCVLTSLSWAQPGKEAWFWPFGDSCSLNFSSGTPIAGFSPINVVEGTASYSDPSTGQLMFFTDGTTIWDKNSNPMPNGTGLYGGYGTSSNAALIVPKPGSASIYFIITADQGGYRPQPVKGVNYSVLDMSLNGGLGDITTKNHPLTPPPTTEKLVGVKHCNGSDYWVITHSFLSDAFNAYKVTSGGIDTVAVVSHVGTIHDDGGKSLDSLGTIGCMKASPDGNKLALAVSYNMPMLELFDFNHSTGVVSNPIKLDYLSGGSWCGPYGVAFSPDSRKLYATFTSYCTNYSAKAAIMQFDLSHSTAASVIASRVRLDSTQQYPGAMQLGPDGKIYITFYLATSLSTINNPNNSGLSCNLQLHAIPLSPGSTAKDGLPNFIDTRDSTSGVVMQNQLSLCSFASYILTGDSGSQYIWNNGDTTVFTTINSFGTYWVNYTTKEGCNETDTTIVLQKAPPVVNMLHDTFVCMSAQSHLVNINASLPGAITYSWDNGSTLPSSAISNPGIHWVEYSFPDFCIARDSFNFTIDTLPVNAGRDTNLCRSPINLVLSASSQATSYLWNTGQISSLIVVSDSGSYWVTVHDSKGCTNSDTVHVGSIKPPVIAILKDTIQCSDYTNPILVDASYPNTILYSWSDGYSGPVHAITTPDVYSVIYTLSNGCVATDNFAYVIMPTPQVELGADMSLCASKGVLSAENPGSTYLWNTMQTSEQIEIPGPGTYWVEVKKNGCIANDTINIMADTSVKPFIMPNIVTPNGDGINDLIDFGVFNFSELQLEIFNRWGIKVFESMHTFCKWAPSLEDGTYYIIMKYKFDCGPERQSKTFQGYITLIK